MCPQLVSVLHVKGWAIQPVVYKDLYSHGFGKGLRFRRGSLQHDDLFNDSCE